VERELKAFAQVLRLDRREKADGAEVDAEHRHRRAAVLAQAAQNRAVAAERDAQVDVAARGSWNALNDVALHRKVGGRVAELSYGLAGQEVGSVRCDGLVVATPAGSTGYNLANGGPVLAWGVEGMVVSFIAPHSLTARALVIAPDDVLTLHNNSQESLNVSIDGRPVGEIADGEAIDARFVDGVATLAQMVGSSFYLRLREKFGRLSR
jgi:NAD+ kinase